MKRFCTLYLPPLLAAIIVIIKLPEVDEWIKSHNLHGAFIIACILVVCGILNHVVTVISPFKKYERIEKNKWILIDQTSKSIHSNLFPEHEILVNIMLPKKRFFCDLEPINAVGLREKIRRLRKRFFVKTLQAVWSSNNHSIDKRIKLTTNQGVSGIAFSQGKAVVTDMTRGRDELNLNQRQIDAISWNGFIISYPVYAFDERYSRLNNDKIIGVVNFSCSNLGAEQIISSQENRKTLTKKVIEFSTICSLIL